MKFVLAENYNDLSQKAAAIIAAQANENPSSVLGLATGGTVLGTYRELIKMNHEGAVDFHLARTFNLDEYAYLPKSHPQTYHTYMCENFFNFISIPADHIHLPDGRASDLEEECAEYEEKIRRSGGIDLQLLGIGENGHIGFNEPGTPFDSITHVVKLTESTRQANSRFFGSDSEKVPTHAITMGIKTIMSSEKILLLVAGEHKSEILKKLIKEEPEEQTPASVLKLHQDVTIIADPGAASLLGEEELIPFK